MGCSHRPLLTSLVSNASDFRVKEGNIFLGATGSGLLGLIAPTDKEFTIVDADDVIASHHPAKLSSSSKPAARTSEPGLSWRQRPAEIVAEAVSALAPLAEVASCLLRL